MRRLLPEPTEQIDEICLLDRTDRVPPPDRPWVMANMVASADGAFAVDGRSGPLAGPADTRVFHTLRAAADAVLAAARTARAERYRRPSSSGRLLDARRAAGLTDAPRLVLVTRSMFLPADLPLLDGQGEPPLVLHPVDADATGAPRGVRTRAVGDGDVDLAEALKGLRADGVEQLLCEGGPDVLGQLHRAGLLDELFLTVSPLLVGGGDVGLLGPGPARPEELRLHRVLEEAGFLFVTYRYAR